MHTALSVLQLFSDGRFHSGEQTGQQLGISRTAVWKAIQHIKQHWGVQVHAVSGKGYRLAEPMTLLQHESIMAGLSLPARRLLCRLQVLVSVDSTNRVLLEASARGEAQSGDVVLAEHQTGGRGRRGRQWVSPFGQNLYLSCLWKFEMDMANLGGLSLATAVAVSRALVRLGLPAGETGVGLKWPNDVIWQGQKLSGILLEMRGEAAGPWQVVIGLGLNTHMTAESAQAVAQPWVALQSLSVDTLDRNQIASTVISELLLALQHYQKAGLTAFMAEWQKLDVAKGKTVNLHLPDKTVSGIARGIDSSGGLRLEVAGQILIFHAGEVSMRVDYHE